MAQELYRRTDKRKNWKAVQFNYAAMSAMDYGEVCLKLDYRTRAILLAALEQVRWVTRWYGDDIDPDIVDKWVDNAAYQLMKEGECGMTIFRQNPTSPCVLQFSNDGGDTWQTMFDYSLCLFPTRKSATQISIELGDINTTIIDTEITYAGDVINIAPAWEYTGGGGDIDIDTALCWALGQIVALFCGECANSIERGNNATKSITDWFSEFDAFAGIALGALTAVGLFPPATAIAAMVLLGASALNEIFEALLLDDITPYQDTDAMQTVSCAMYDRLKGSTPQYSAFIHCLDDLQTGNAEIIRQAMLKVIESEQLYQQLMIVFNGAIALASEGKLTCPCNAAEWVILYDNDHRTGFTVLDNGTFPPSDPSNLNDPSGVWAMDEQYYDPVWMLYSDGYLQTHHAIGVRKSINLAGGRIVKISASGNCGTPSSHGDLKIKVKIGGVWSGIQTILVWDGTTYTEKQGDVDITGATEIALIGYVDAGLYLPIVKMRVEYD